MLNLFRKWLAKVVCSRGKDVNYLLSKKNAHTVFPSTKKKSGKDTGEPAVKVLVESKQSEEELDEKDIIPKRIKGIKTDVEEVDLPEAYADRNEYNPLKGGCEIAPKGANFVGTLGGLYARRKYTTSSGKEIYLHNRWLGIINLLEKWGLGPEIEKEIVGTTNVHVIADDVANPKKGRIIVQPGGSGRQIGTVSDWESLDPNQTNEADLGLVEIYKKFKDNVSGEMIEAGKIKKPKKLPGADWYQKYGRTTRYTKGNLLNYPASSRVNYGNYTIQFRNLGIVDERGSHSTFSDNGDSGSDVLDQDGHLRGKLFAGNGDITLIFPMKQFFNKYKLSLIDLEWTKYDAE